MEQKHNLMRHVRPKWNYSGHTLLYISEFLSSNFTAVILGKKLF